MLELTLKCQHCNHVFDIPLDDKFETTKKGSDYMYLKLENIECVNCGTFIHISCYIDYEFIGMAGAK